jgi:hypothetical protein
VMVVLLSRAASSTGKVKYGTFLASGHQEVSAALCEENHAIFRAGVQLYTRASSHACVPGIMILSADVESYRRTGNYLRSAQNWDV